MDLGPRSFADTELTVQNDALQKYFEVHILTLRESAISERGRPLYFFPVLFSGFPVFRFRGFPTGFPVVWVLGLFNLGSQPGFRVWVLGFLGFRRLLACFCELVRVPARVRGSSSRFTVFTVRSTHHFLFLTDAGDHVNPPAYRCSAEVPFLARAGVAQRRPERHSHRDKILCKGAPAADPSTLPDLLNVQNMPE